MSKSPITGQTLLLFAPLIVIQLALMVAALVDLAKRKKVTGPIVYFVVGRKED